MAQKVLVTMTDDLDGTPGTDEEKVETVSFSLDKHSGEIDLCPANRLKLRELLAPYFEHGRPASAGYRRAMTPVNGSSARPAGRTTHVPPPRNRASRDRAGNIRKWAKEQGIQVGEKGRIPGDIEKKYDAAHPITV